MADLLIATVSGLFEATLDGGATPEAVALGGGRVVAVTGAGDEPLALTPRAVHRRLPDGTWDQEFSLPDDDPEATCVVATDGSVFVGTREARLLRFVDGELSRAGGFDDVEGRDRWYTPWGSPPDTRSLSAGDGTVFAGVHVGGIVRSVDGGDSWLPCGFDIDHDVHQVLAAGGGRVVAAAGEGFFASHDGGASFVAEHDGLPERYCRAVAVAGDSVLVTASKGPGGGGAAVLRRPLEGGTFERCDKGLPERIDGNIDTGCLAGDATGRVAVATPDGRVFASADAGETWDEIASGLPEVNALAFLR